MNFAHLYSYLPPPQAAQMVEHAKSLQDSLMKRPRHLTLCEPAKPKLRERKSNLPPPIPEASLENFLSHGIGSASRFWMDRVPSGVVPEKLETRICEISKRRRLTREELHEARALRPALKRRKLIAYVHAYGHIGQKSRWHGLRKPR